MTKHNLLIPLDGSEHSRQILSHVRRLLHPKDYALILFRVVQLPAGITAAPPRPVSLAWPAPMLETRRDVEFAQHPIYATQTGENVRAAIERELLPDAQALQEEGYEVTVDVGFGDPAEEIIAYARCRPVDLVAMATHGRTGLSQFVLGSVAERMLRSLSVPIVLVRPSA